ncbi:substrate-binding domain-containing protein [Methylobacter luteus]|uniref:substrate-binding domain-containing protein n=1 Tax=Methylobacter luteus TaxID=415 RepID=UPI00041A5D8D|nr:substrate-binding domain-containing protein [Methylobacter luteus]
MQDLRFNRAKADAGIAMGVYSQAIALDFIPRATKRFDLGMRRRDCFAPPIQALFALSRSKALVEKAEELGADDIKGLGNIIVICDRFKFTGRKVS